MSKRLRKIRKLRLYQQKRFKKPKAMIEGVQLHKDNTVFILGNGPSRNLFDLHSLPGSIYACNRAYADPRVPKPDKLFATDKPMCEEIINSSYSGIVVTREDKCAVNTNPKIHLINYKAQLHHTPGVPPSGVRALIYAAHEQKWDYIFLLGFDLHSRDGSKIQNVYAGTKFYEGNRDSVKKSIAERWVNMLDEYSPFFIRVVADQSYTNANWNDVYYKDFLEFLSGAVTGSRTNLPKTTS